MGTLNRVQYLLIVRDERQQLVRLTDDGYRITVQTPTREAFGEPPETFAEYKNNGLSAGINAAIIEALFKLQYRTKIDQSVASKIYAKDVKKITDDLTGRFIRDHKT